MNNLQDKFEKYKGLLEELYELTKKDWVYLRISELISKKWGIDGRAGKVLVDHRWILKRSRKDALGYEYKWNRQVFEPIHANELMRETLTYHNEQAKNRVSKVGEKIGVSNDVTKDSIIIVSDRKILPLNEHLAKIEEKEKKVRKDSDLAESTCYLTGNKEAIIWYPKDLNDKDIVLLKHHIEGILLRVQLDKK